MDQKVTDNSVERFDPGDLDFDKTQAGYHLARYLWACGFAKGKTCLDMACGTGYGTRELRLGGAESVVGVDIDPSVIESANREYSGQGIEFQAGDAETFAPGRKFSLVVSFETIEHLADPARFLRNIRSILSPAGEFLVSTPCRQHGQLADKPANPFHVREWNQAEFTSLLKEHFDQVEMFGQGIEFRKGTLPFARTFAYWQSRLVHRRLAQSLFQAEPIPLVGFPTQRLKIAYLVAKCSG